MKKNDLIKKLQAIEGNPEILLWNGYVEDWMRFDLSVNKVYKESKVKLERLLRAELGRNPTAGELDFAYSNCDWEFRNPFVGDGDLKNFYGKSKNIILIQAKQRGKSHWDRAGKIFY